MRLPRRDAVIPGPNRLLAARVVGAAGLLVYNWWIPAIVVRRGFPKADAFFSDLSANSEPHAKALQRLDLLAAALILLALLLRGPLGRSGRRKEWPVLVAFAVASGVGGLFPFQCASTGNAVCRQLESQLQLPLHHYLHILAAVAEFGFATAAILLARASADIRTPEGRMVRRIFVTVALCYPMLAASFFTRRWGAFIEPVYFVSFSLIVAAELFAPPPPSGWSPTSEPAALTDIIDVRDQASAAPPERSEPSSSTDAGADADA